VEALALRDRAHRHEDLPDALLLIQAGADLERRAEFSVGDTTGLHEHMTELVTVVAHGSADHAAVQEVHDAVVGAQR